jgi:hypothetical protein
MIDIQSAAAFVNNHGDATEQARLRYLLNGERPSQETVSALLAGQREDGGWAPFWASAYSSLDATCFHLAQAEQLGISGSEPATGRALDFLANRQRTSGSWSEDESVTDLAPPWVKPGETSAILYLTANCGFWLAVRQGTFQNVARRAADYLLGYLDNEGHMPTFLHAHWLAGGLWHSLDQQEPAARVFGYLANRAEALPASNLAWLIITLHGAGVPPSHPLLDTAASLLAHQQARDGRWPSEDGSARDIHATLEAMRALRLCGRF